MPKNLTDIDAFTSPVTVPVGTDSRNNAAGDVELLAQALADRTRNNKNRLDANDLVRAELDVANTFTAGPQTVDDASGNGVIATTVYPDLVSAGNNYKQIGRFKLSSSMFARTFVGDPVGGQGGFVITINAFWTIGTQVWQADDTGNASWAMFIGFGANDVLFTERAAGAGTWATWATTTSSLSQLRCREVDAYNLFTNNNIDCSGDLDVGGDATVTGNFLYTTAKTRTTVIPLFDFQGSGTTFVTFGRDGLQFDTGVVMARLHLPAGAVLNTVECIVTAAGATAITMRAHIRTAGDYSTPAHTTGSQEDSDATTGAGEDVLSVDFGGVTVSSSSEYWVSLDGGQAGDKVWNARIFEWTDPGPRNI